MNKNLRIAIGYIFGHRRHPCRDWKTGIDGGMSKLWPDVYDLGCP